MNRMTRLSRLSALGVAVALGACGGTDTSGRNSGGTGGGPTAAEFEALKAEVQASKAEVKALTDELEKEKAYLRSYFEKPGDHKKAAWAYWSRLADAICDIEKRTQGLPPVGNRMCPDDGGGPDKIAPPSYPPQ